MFATRMGMSDIAEEGGDQRSAVTAACPRLQCQSVLDTSASLFQTLVPACPQTLVPACPRLYCQPVLDSWCRPVLDGCCSSISLHNVHIMGLASWPGRCEAWPGRWEARHIHILFSRAVVSDSAMERQEEEDETEEFVFLKPSLNPYR